MLQDQSSSPRSVNVNEDLPPPKRVKVDKVDEEINSKIVKVPERELPVTLLSGFLGAGKTTLLKHILRTTGENMRIAVVVNDMGVINLDAAEIKRHGLIQEKAEMVELQNGCICCTLRGDLLKTVRDLALETEENGNSDKSETDKKVKYRYDYLVIESTGIAEPLPVAQTFVMDASGTCEEAEEAEEAAIASEEKKSEKNEAKQELMMTEKGAFQPLSNFARLDTLVTVVDAYNVLNVLGSVETLAERQKLLGDEGSSKIMENAKDNPTSEGEQKKDAACDGQDHDHKHDHSHHEEEEEKSICQLLLDQIEFANVILVNKTDLLLKENENGKVKVEQVKNLIQKLNPGAEVIVPEEPYFKGFRAEDKIINTKKFNLKNAQESAGWMKELENEAAGNHHTPETEEYGIGSLLFRNHEKPFHTERLRNILKGFGHLDLSSAEESKTNLFAGVIRAKGQVWIANVNAYPVNIHCAGRQMEINLQIDNAYVGAILDFVNKERSKSSKTVLDKQNNEQDDDDLDIPPEDLDTIEADINPHKQSLIKQNKWNDVYGDRHSNFVCIGVNLDKEAIKNALENALMTDAEMKEAAEKGVEACWRNLADPFFGGAAATKYFELSPEYFVGDDEQQEDEDEDENENEDENEDDEMKE